MSEDLGKKPRDLTSSRDKNETDVRPDRRALLKGGAASFVAAGAAFGALRNREKTRATTRPVSAKDSRDLKAGPLGMPVKPR